ncbi:MAG: glycosyltransferase family 2 protein [Planctomycetota bacterium]|nr:glycosyltransferase family 2 protein [Planctomycetota bacterium]
MDTKTRLVAGIINYHSHDIVPACVDALRRSSLPPARILIADNASDPESAAALVELVGEENLLDSAENRGYAGGANAILRATPEARFVLLLNPDVVVGERFCEELVRVAEAEPRAAALQGKLVRPDGDILDSTGVEISRSGRNRDRGAGEPDDAGDTIPQEVFGATGAAMLLRREALDDLRLNDEWFDEDFLVYHEDNDLCWRARLLGWTVLYVPTARAIHGRGYRAGERTRASRFVRHHAFKNHYLKLVKNLLPRQFCAYFFHLAGWEVVRLGYAVVREPFLWRAWRDALGLLPRAWRKRRQIQRRRRVKHAEIDRWFR